MAMAVALVTGLCVLAYTLAIYALPFMIGVEPARWAYASGLIGGGRCRLWSADCAVHDGASANPAPRRGVRLRPTATIAGYALVHGITRDAVLSDI